MIKKIGFAAAAFAAVPGVAHAAEGLRGAYYAGGYGGNIAGAPTATFTATTICFPNCGLALDDSNSLSSFLNVAGGHVTDLSHDLAGLSGHALTLLGSLYVPTSGVQNLAFVSDDGAFLQLDGQTVVNIAGDHALHYVETLINLRAGRHTIYIYQEENADVTGLSAWLNGMPLSGAMLSTSVPEASTWAMMIVGVGFAGVALRRRQAVLRAA